MNLPFKIEIKDYSESVFEVIKKSSVVLKLDNILLSVFSK
jgi:hypothetical protein